MTLGDKGTVFVGTRREGVVYALVDTNQDNQADKIYTIARGLNMPNGVAFRDGALYVAEVQRVIRFDDIENRLENPPAPVVVRSDFPRQSLHGWKFIAFGPDGKLYVPVGAPCNICKSKDERFASLLRMDANGQNLEIFAQGIRNTVGFDWHPQTGVLWFSDNGRDWLGDTVPPDELNLAPEKGLHFGFPHIHGRSIRDPQFGQETPPRFTPPAGELEAHVAALGVEFYNGDQFPAQYRNALFVAEHGSWNRSAKVGYKVGVAFIDGSRVTGYEPFATGWLKNEQVSGRPVDIETLPDGSLLVSDDFDGTIYRIYYSGQ